MKKLMLMLFGLAFLVVSPVLHAQSPIDKVFDKYAGQDDFVTVNITKDLFQMMMQMAQNNVKDTTMAEVKSMMDKINGIKILTFKFDSTKIVRAVSVYNEFAGLFPASSYKELITITEGRQNIRFLTKQDPKGVINEMVMLMKDKSEVAVMSMTGVIDLATVAKISGRMNIKGLDNLKKMAKQPSH